MSAYCDTGEVDTDRGRGGDGLCGIAIALIALHPLEFAHQLRALGECLVHHQAFADEASPKQSD
jgi:hypothetical protein